MGQQAAVGANSLFDGYIQLGRRVMSGVDQNDHAAIRYKWLLGEISALLKVTHGIVVDKLEQIIATDSIDVARGQVEQLREGALESTFRAQGFCDAFDGLGSALMQLYSRTQPQGSGFLSAEEGRTMQEVSWMLSEREGEVATRYEEEILSLAELVSTTNEDLPTIRAKAAKARKVLVDQQADFDALAARFKQLSKT